MYTGLNIATHCIYCREIFFMRNKMPYSPLKFPQHLSFKEEGENVAF